MKDFRQVFKKLRKDFRYAADVLNNERDTMRNNIPINKKAGKMEQVKLEQEIERSCDKAIDALAEIL